MTFVTKLIFPNVSRHSNASRMATELANCNTALDLSNVSSAAGAAQATNTTGVKNANTINYSVNGQLGKTKAATDPLWTLSGAVVQAASWQKYALLLDAAGTATVQEATQSKVSAALVSWVNVSNVSVYAPLLSILNAGKVVACVVTVATDATHTFTPGTTSLTGTGITTTFEDGIDPSFLPILATTTGAVIGLGG